MGKFFKDINLEKNDFNSKLFLFLLFVTDIIDRIDRNINNHNYILNFFEKELDPLKELNEQKELKIKYESFEEDTSEKYWGIKKRKIVKECIQFIINLNLLILKEKIM